MLSIWSVYEKVFERNNCICFSGNGILSHSFYCWSNGWSGLVVVIWFATLLLSIVFGLVSQKKRKIIYPFVVAVLFIPTVYIHYNYTAFGHVVWYLIDSYLGVGIGSLIKMITDVLSQKKR